MAKDPIGYGVGGYGAGVYGGGGVPIFSEPVAYYLARFTSQYQQANKLLAWSAAALQFLDDVTACLYSFFAAFDLSTAVGAQLDVLGEIVGVGRELPFQPSVGSPVLGDSDYRVLLQAQIGRNTWNGTIDGLQQLWLQLFPNGQIVIQDNQDMTFNVILSGAFTTIIEEMITHDLIVPRPEGVLINYFFSMLPIFGADLNNSFIAGADLGHAA